MCFHTILPSTTRSKSWLFPLQATIFRSVLRALPIPLSWVCLSHSYLMQYIAHPTVLSVPVALIFNAVHCPSHCPECDCHTHIWSSTLPIPLSWMWLSHSYLMQYIAHPTVLSVTVTLIFGAIQITKSSTSHFFILLPLSLPTSHFISV
jgi:hypothetical protein